MSTYKVKVILEVEAENYDEAEEQAMFAINDAVAYTDSIEVLEDYTNGR